MRRLRLVQQGLQLHLVTIQGIKWRLQMLRKRQRQESGADGIHILGKLLLGQNGSGLLTSRGVRSIGTSQGFKTKENVTHTQRSPLVALLRAANPCLERRGDALGQDLELRVDAEETAHVGRFQGLDEEPLLPPIGELGDDAGFSVEQSLGMVVSCSFVCECSIACVS